MKNFEEDAFKKMLLEDHNPGDVALEKLEQMMRCESSQNDGQTTGGMKRWQSCMFSSQKDLTTTRNDKYI